MTSTPSASRRHARLTRGSLAVAVTAALAVAAPVTRGDVARADTSDPSADCSKVAWMDRAKTPDERAHALLAASTLDQKLRWLDETSANNPQQTEIPVRNPANVGQTTNIYMPPQLPCTPTIQYADGPEYVVAGSGVTYFPAPIANAAAWSSALAREKGAAMADEAWRKQRNVLLAPGVSSARDPRAGRTSEYLGEDALLSGRLAGAASQGIHSNANEPVESMIKHYVANEQETDRQLSSSNVDERTLREIYTLPFEVAIDRGDIDSVMCSYNQVNSAWACGNALTLKRILKTEIGFQGYVVTDFFDHHDLGANPPDLKAGLDQELNAWLYWSPDLLKQALVDGRISEADIDNAAFRVVRSHIRSGLFDVPRPSASQDVVTTEAHKAVAREVAERGSVLLKNDGVLPLAGPGKTIAVIGPTAANTPAPDDVDASSVCTYGVRFPSGCSAVAPLDSIRERAAQAGDTVVYADGSDPAAAAALAKQADVVLAFGYYREGEFADRANLSLDGGGDALIDTVSKANPNTVVVLQTGGPVLMPWLSQVKGVLETWYAGEQMGPAVAALLYGDVNPSGRLPITFPKAEADLPTAGSARQFPGTFADGSTTGTASVTNIRQVDYTEGLKVGYRWYASQGIRPLFPFGYGLSYGKVDYEKLTVSPRTETKGRDLRLRVRVRNTGSRPVTETVQAYVHLPSRAHEPSKRLLAWQQVTLEPGERRNVRMTVSAADIRDLHLLQYWDGDWRTADGAYRVTVGGSFDTALARSFTYQARR